MTHLDITERRNESIAILKLKGNITIGEDAALLRKTLRALVDKEEKKILLNMADVSYIDSSGLGELVSGYSMLKDNDGAMKLLHLSHKVHQLMTMTKLLTVFDVYENEQEAINSFNNSNVKAHTLVV